MPANFGLLPELDNRVNNKRERYKKYRDRAERNFDNEVEKFKTRVGINA